MATTAPFRLRSRTREDAPIAARLSHLLRLWHLTSLDAPTVAVTWTLAIAAAFRIYLPLWLPITLALAAWSAYIADRLLDVYRARPHPLIENTLRPRHLFHWRHRRLFIPIAAAAAAAALTLVFINMPTAARARNSILAAATLVYFTSIHNPWQPALPKLRIPKELFVALIFTLACAIPAWTRIPAQRTELVLPTLIFIALAWLNCHAIELWESETSFVQRHKLLPAAAALAISALAAATLTFITGQPRIAALEAAAALSATFLTLLNRHHNRLHPTTLRAAADLVLLTPLALVALQLSTS